jgi:hypothetical protein
VVRFGPVLAIACACGRIDFTPRDAGAGDARVLPDGPNAGANLVFVTSTQPLAGSLGGIAGADAVCSERATASGLPGTYVAFVSTSTTNAIDRIAGARGWIRVDGLPFADTPADIAAGHIFYPVGLDESGAFTRTYAVTASDATGHFDGNGCSDFTSTVETQCTIGYTRATGSEGIVDPHVLGLCDFGASLYCFGVSQSLALVPPAPLSGLRVFVSTPWQPGGGLASADARCAADAAAAGWTGTFRAMLATATATAASRFTSSSGPVVRADGVPVAADVVTLMSGALETSIDLSATGAVANDVDVWAGAFSPTQLPSGAYNACTSWTSTSSTALAPVGHAAEADVGFFGVDATGFGDNIACSMALPVYCLEQ